MEPKLDKHRYGIAGPCHFKPEDERCLSCILDNSDYFIGLPIDAKVSLQHGMQLKTFPRRAVLYREGSRNNHLYILISGGVRVGKSMMDGRQLIHKIVSIPGDLIACEDLFLKHQAARLSPSAMPPLPA
ncbi:MAG: cyclic nucleotide-binding domain-containing protein [Gammaproteobacteria bacterium]|nr:cyclic nucleotide-binding domain-containing protein [Gammaproteobacteria bacterium]MBU1978004.1 cyclic nucleotide-binding domain-containing protein [Gammaproteobacteria bacterium]